MLTPKKQQQTECFKMLSIIIIIIIKVRILTERSLSLSIQL